MQIDCSSFAKISSSRTSISYFLSTSLCDSSSSTLSRMKTDRKRVRVLNGNIDNQRGAFPRVCTAPVTVAVTLTDRDPMCRIAGRHRSSCWKLRSGPGT